MNTVILNNWSLSHIYIYIYKIVKKYARDKFYFIYFINIYIYINKIVGVIASSAYFLTIYIYIYI